MKITANKSARTYTIRINFGRCKKKYRTYPMTKKEFDSAYYWTNNDWNQFLKTNDYFIVN